MEDNFFSSENYDRYPNPIDMDTTYYGYAKQSILRIGDMAPGFTAKTTFGECSLSDYKGRWLVLFSHPGDFTPVCTTEFLAFTKYYPRFKNKNCELLGLSIDSNASHLAWVYDIYKNTGVQIPFPIIEDRNKTIAETYNMVAPNVSNNSTIRSVYIICPKGIIRAILSYPMTTGRNIGEILRIVEALQMTDNESVVTPANWMPKMPTIATPPTTYSELSERLKDYNNYTCSNWYLCFNNTNNGMNNIIIDNAPTVNLAPENEQCYNRFDETEENIHKNQDDVSNDNDCTEDQV